jgi:hypothetical protein
MLIEKIKCEEVGDIKELTTQFITATPREFS